MSLGRLQTEADLVRFIEQREMQKPPQVNGGTGFDTAGPGLTGSGTVVAADFGSGPGKVTEGNDPRLSDARVPVAHSHPQSDVTNLVSDLAGKASSSDARFPTADEKAALAGTSGIPSNGNRYVTSSDPAMTNARPPTAHTHPQSEVTNLVTDLALKAPLNSPALMGNPTAPTQTPGTGKGPNKTRLANTEYVDKADDLVRMGFTIKEPVDFATVAPLPGYTKTGSVTATDPNGVPLAGDVELTATANGTLRDALGFQDERYRYATKFGWIAGFRPVGMTRAGGSIYTLEGDPDSPNNPDWLLMQWDETTGGAEGLVFTLPQGTGSGELTECTGLARDSSGNFYTTAKRSGGTLAIHKFNASGTWVSSIATPRVGVQIDSSGNIWCRDVLGVYKYSSGGSLLASISKFNFCFALDSTGRPYLAELAWPLTGKIYVYTNAGAAVTNFTVPLLAASVMAVAPDGSLFLNEGGRVVKCDSSGTYVCDIGAPGLGLGLWKGVVALTASNSVLWGSDTGNRRTQFFSQVPAGTTKVGDTVLVKDAIDRVDNGTWRVKAVGGVSSKWKLERRDYALPTGSLVAPAVEGDRFAPGMYYLVTPDAKTETTIQAWELYRMAPTSHADTHRSGGQDEIPGLVPTGATMIWDSATAPDGWLLLDGSTYQTATYPDLAAFYGAGGSTFTVPDRRGRMPLGASGSYPLGSTGGAATVTLTVAQLPAHSHNLSYSTLKNNNSGSFDITRTPGTGANSASTANAGSGDAHENLPPYWATNWIVKT